MSDLEESGGGTDSTETGYGSEYSEEYRSTPIDHELPYFSEFQRRKGLDMELPLATSGAGTTRYELCLVGYLVDIRQFHSRFVQQLVNELWRTREPVRVEGRSDNFYVFHFRNEVDLHFAISRGPWSLRGALLALDYWRNFMALGRAWVKRLAVWVRLVNLPLEYLTVEAATLLGRAVGEVVRVDVDERPTRNIRYVRVRVWIDPEKPLVSGFYLRCADGSRRWIACRYERVCKLCRACGRIGHTYPQCDLMEEDARALVDNHLQGMGDRLSATILEDPRFPLYGAFNRAYAHHPERRNTRMRVPPEQFPELDLNLGLAVPRSQVEERLEVPGSRTPVAGRTGVGSPPLPPPPPPSPRLHSDQVAQATQTEVLQENANHFLAVYDQQWEWGMQARELEEEEQNRVAQIASNVGSLPGSEQSIPAPEEMDGRWQDWSVILTRFGINAGSWGLLNDIPEQILRDPLSNREGSFPYNLELVMNAGYLPWINENEVGFNVGHNLDLGLNSLGPEAREGLRTSLGLGLTEQDFFGPGPTSNAPLWLFVRLSRNMDLITHCLLLNGVLLGGRMGGGGGGGGGGGCSYWGTDAEDCGSANSFRQSGPPKVVLLLPPKKVAKRTRGLAPNVREGMRARSQVRGTNRALHRKRNDAVSLARRISGIWLRMLQSARIGKGFSWGNCLAKMVVERARRTLKRAYILVDDEEGPPRRKSRSSSSSSSESSPKSDPSSQAPVTTSDNVLDFDRRGRDGVTASLGIDACGSKGGLWAAWDNSMTVQVMETNFHFLLLKLVDGFYGDWLLLLIYGHPVLSRREDTWAFLCDVASKLSGPLLVMGDFNQVLSVDEKFSAHTGPIRGLDWCSNFVTRCGLADVPSFGVKFTWSNNRSGEAATYEKLDRAMAYQRIQRFEEAWVGIDAVRHIAKKVWDVPLTGSFAFKVMQKQKMLLRHLANWKKLSIGYLTEEIVRKKRELEKIQLQLDGQFWGSEAEVLVKQDLMVRSELENLLTREEVYWAQRAKQNWLTMGDRNTKYFHKIASIRAHKNRAVALRDSSGVLVTDPDAIEAMFLDHFRSIFRCEEGSSVSRQGYLDYENGVRDGDRVNPSLLATIKTKLTDVQRQELDRPITPDEIRKAMFQMDGRKAPGPDGFVAAFYQENWDWMGMDIVQASLAFFESGFMLKELNQTLITLIPKVPNPQCVSDFRPISLCNVLYKVLSKVLVNRLRLVLRDLISQYQNGFVPTRMISDNMLIAHEMLEFIRKRKRGRRALYALKLDMNKAYDRVDWNFLLGVLRTMGFSQQWVGWIQQCISTVSFSVVVNGRR
ncbi:hypothetical protein RHSIM_Rhsim02G0226500 [Rhododendron simsii]|uniref:Reverse transcriptase domain-containing protein n=1 Tax=Rhododendron simsii TaxID=118357 RepID=A0A834HDZ2_RHOSS|nr:hypothetical protein RHSIM_Rhsim02G0226500 [Rhododendron simsii]